MPSRPSNRPARRLASPTKRKSVAELPAFIPPQLATLVDRAPPGAEWVHEMKFDGYRTAARIEAGKARMLTRNGLDWSDRFGPIAAAAAAQKARTAYLDSEVVVLDEAGISDFGGLQDALSEHRAGRMVYFAFDVLHLDGKDLTGLPLVDRKAALEELLFGVDRVAPIRFSDHYVGRGPEFFEQACRLMLEGIVSKRAGAPYRPGRSADWLKTKCTRRQEVVIGGWRRSTASGRDLGSLLVGYYRDGKLQYAGKVGTGFSQKVGRELIAKLEKHGRKDSPFVDVPRAEGRDARWVEPALVAEVEFTAWTRDGHLRHPSFKGLREDKGPREVRAEHPQT
jgi:bifunctional non-homologous end joining protein LigD